MDMHRAAAAQGMLASVRLWLAVLLDLASSVMRERIRTMLSSKSAAALSAILCLPSLFAFITAMFNYEPPFVQQYLTEPNGYTPSMLGRIVMLGMLFSLPAAFVINLLPMLTKAGSERTMPF